MGQEFAKTDTTSLRRRLDQSNCSVNTDTKHQLSKSSHGVLDYKQKLSLEVRSYSSQELFCRQNSSGKSSQSNPIAGIQARSQSNQSLLDSRPPSSQSNPSFLDRFPSLSLQSRLFSSQPDLHSIDCSTRKQRILMLGLDGAGKTTLFHRMRNFKIRGDTCPSLEPTIAYNLTPLYVDGRACTLWDVSGSPLTRDLWKHYLSGTDCLVWVVDSSNVCRIEESRVLLNRMLLHRSLHGVPLVVVASKQDLPTARTVSELEELLMLADIREKGHSIKLITSSATSGKDTRKVMKKVKKLLGKVQSSSLDCGQFNRHINCL